MNTDFFVRSKTTRGLFGGYTKFDHAVRRMCKVYAEQADQNHPKWPCCPSDLEVVRASMESVAKSDEATVLAIIYEGRTFVMIGSDMDGLTKSGI